jgi:uncharacterized protein with gpF-like domain
MPILLDAEQLKKLKRRKRAKKMSPQKPPAMVERAMKRRLAKLWREVLRPATDQIKAAVKRGASPSELADMVEAVLQQAELVYGVAAEDIVWRWKSSLELETRVALQKGLNHALGVSVAAITDPPHVRQALDAGLVEATQLIRTIPSRYLGEVARAVNDNFLGRPLPQGRSLMAHIDHLYGVGERRARVIARDQTTKMAGKLNQVRQESLGIKEYVWKTAHDNRVVGNPSGLYPGPGNDRHQDHYHRDGKRFKWAEPPPDGHPGQAIQCRCRADPVIDVEEILAHAARA